MTTDQSLREHVAWLLQVGNAHMPLREAVADFPMERINELFPKGSYSAWALLEHLRITQWDILDFIRNSNYKYMEWPREYWPPEGSTATPHDWQDTLARFESDQQELVKIVEDPSTDLFARIPHGEGQDILREMLVVADHNAYHIGEFAIMRQVMGTWPEGHQ